MIPTEILSRYSAAQLNVSALQFPDSISLAKALLGSAYALSLRLHLLHRNLTWRVPGLVGSRHAPGYWTWAEERKELCRSSKILETTTNLIVSTNCLSQVVRSQVMQWGFMTSLIRDCGLLRTRLVDTERSEFLRSSFIKSASPSIEALVL